VRLGGTVAYAALAAQRQGRCVGVVTSAGPDLDVGAHLPGIAVHQIAAPATTRFRNEYHNGDRRQVLRARAAPLTLQAVPQAWRRAAIVHLAPLAWEVDLTLAAALADTAGFVGATAQGWLRGWDADGVVSSWPCDGLDKQLGRVAAIVVSAEDLAAEPEYAARLAAAGPIVAETLGADGVRILERDQTHLLPACPACASDPTGAGDVFAAAWFIRLAAGASAASAARYAATAAAYTVERHGLMGVPTLGEIEERLARWVG